MRCNCGSVHVARIERKWWQRLLPLSRRFSCLVCQRRFLRLALR